ncbi:MAG TPA: uridine kinase [Polyangia bacterium]|nr:uridine kinase [Polyangia bacterium]
MQTSEVLVLGIAGGTGSGKTTVALKITAALPPGAVALLDHDAYYRDLSHLPLQERVRINYDHPDALESELLVEHLRALRAGQAVAVPAYDFRAHVRERATRRLEPAPIVIVEGILVLADPKLREQMDVKIFVDTDPDIRVFRRVRRDMEQRGRTFSQVREQYYQTVRPMHLQYVEPSKRYADLIIPEGGENRVAIDLIIGRLRHALAVGAGAGEGVT